MAAVHPSTDQLSAVLADIADSPKDTGTVDQIVARPQAEERAVVAEAELDTGLGLVGDNWLERGSRHTDDGAAEPDRQLTLMNSRAVAAIAGSEDRWRLAGDQLFVDLDLSPRNLPPGSRLHLGSCDVEVTAAPHLGCAKFLQRFGQDAARFVNSDEGKALNLRGINARVVTSGRVSAGDAITVTSRG